MNIKYILNTVFGTFAFFKVVVLVLMLMAMMATVLFVQPVSFDMELTVDNADIAEMIGEDVPSLNTTNTTIDGRTHIKISGQAPYHVVLQQGWFD